jgi:ATP-dependent DNA ligase
MKASRPAEFINPMECLPVATIPEGASWIYEIKLDGYRAQAVKHPGRVTLYSRRKHVLNNKFNDVVSALDHLPDETVIDGELVAIGGYVPSHLGVDSIVVGFYRGKDLIFSGRIRAGFVPLTRREVFRKLKPLEVEQCPFANLPQKTAGRWGQGLTAAKMGENVWVKPKLVAEIAFLEWTTDANLLRHAAFVGLRADKDPRKVVRET